MMLLSGHLRDHLLVFLFSADIPGTSLGSSTVGPIEGSCTNTSK
jgi:hypothetical protein